MPHVYTTSTTITTRPTSTTNLIEKLSKANDGEKRTEKRPTERGRKVI